MAISASDLPTGNTKRLETLFAHSGDDQGSQDGTWTDGIDPNSTLLDDLVTLEAVIERMSCQLCTGRFPEQATPTRARVKATMAPFVEV